MKITLHCVIFFLLCGLGLGNLTSSAVAQPPAPGKFSLVGLGPAGPEHATLKAIETIKRADLVLCHPELAEPFQAYLTGKKVHDP
jgi:uroporphyrin-III C-methyltransferase